MPPASATSARISASCSSASIAIANTSATISTSAASAGSSGCSLTAASAVRYITAMPKPCSTSPYSRRWRCSFQPVSAAASPAAATAR